VGLEGQAKRLHPFGRAVASSIHAVHTLKEAWTLDIQCTFARDAFCHARKFAHKLNGHSFFHWHYSINQKYSFIKDGSLPPSKQICPIHGALQEGTHLTFTFLNQRHVESAYGFRMLKGVECLPEHEAF
jgi:hypothetical protein